MEQLSPAMKQYISNTQGVNNSNVGNPIIQNNQVNPNLEQKPDTFEKSSNIEKKKTDKNKTGIIIGAAVAAAAVIGGIIYAVKTGKIGKSKEATKKAAEEITKGLNDIKFEKGIASLKENGEKFTGKLNHTLKSGDKVVLEYADGVLQKSTRSGAQNFEKVYQTINNEKIVSITKNGITETKNITKIGKEAIQKVEKAAQEAGLKAKIQEEVNSKQADFDIKSCKTLDNTNIKSHYKDHYQIETENQGHPAYLSCHSNGMDPIFWNNIPEYYIDQDGLCRYLNVSRLNGSGGGSGTKAIKQAVLLSKDLGYDGKIILDAEIIDKAKGSPVPFYYKLGFKSVHKNVQKEIDEAMIEYFKTGVYNGPGAVMYLPKEAMEKILLG